MAAEDTIFAVATGIGRAALSVVRVSGLGASEAARKIGGQIPPPRRATLRCLRCPRSGDVIDRGLVIWFPGPASFTGEDCCEFHVHGGRAVLRSMVEALAKLPNFRLAKPGEFTRRAFANGKMDLLAVEGLGDLIEAETDLQRRQALDQMDGRLANRIEHWRQILLEARALVEAEIDFVEEDEAPKATLLAVREMIRPMRREIVAILDQGRSGEIIREGFSVVLAGPPNAGKSTLLNAIAQRDIAIVTEHAGTTRDVIEVRLDLEGMPIILADTAGVRRSDDPVEKEGIARTYRRAREAQLVLWLNESGQSLKLPEDFAQTSEIVAIGTKSDLHPELEGCGGLMISAKTGEGLAGLIALIRDKARAAMVSSVPVLISRERHRLALKQTQEQLGLLLDGDVEIEVCAEYLRAAGQRLESIIGKIGVEQVLGEIFAKFCMGK